MQPPDGVSSGKACMMELEMRDGGNLLLCAESADDMKYVQFIDELSQAFPCQLLDPVNDK